MASPRIAVLGLHHEGNRWAPVVHRADLRITSGPALIDDARAQHPRVTGGTVGFVRAMDDSGPWTPMPIVLADAGAAGPLDHAMYLELKEEMRRGLEAAMPLDGVYFAEHGASISTGSHDPDGELYAMARAIVGPSVPIVTILDLHAMVSDEMVDMVDYVSAYLTNPHVDQVERGRECARAMRDLLAGMKTAKAFIRLPLMAPQVTQLTASGPYGEIIDYGQTKLDGTVLNVSILGGFTYGDTPYNGMAFIVTTRDDGARARSLCRELAERTWAQRHRFVPRLTTLDDCVAGALARAADPSLPPAVIADVADNPGGGGRGNTLWLMKALHAAGAEGVILGHLFDAPLAAEAHRLGVGASFEAQFNRAEDDPRSERLSFPATVLGLSDGVFVGQEGGSRAGMTVDLGPSAVLRVGALTVAVISKRQQTIDPGYFENLGVSVTDARTVVVKSRGHFRAGFSKYFRPDQIIEADVPGLTSPNLGNFEFRNVVRPLFPLDTDVPWTPPAW